MFLNLLIFLHINSSIIIIWQKIRKLTDSCTLNLIKQIMAKYLVPHYAITVMIHKEHGFYILVSS